MSADKARRASASSTARKAAGTAAKGAAKSAAKGAARAATTKAVTAGGQRIGRGTRWTEEQVKLLLDTVGATDTAKEAFEKVARELGKSTGTVAQKYYNLQKGSGGSGNGGARRGGRPRGASASNRAGGARSTGASRTGATGGGSLPTAPQLRDVTVDELTGLAGRVKAEIDRRRTELDAAAKQLAG